jgi:hypothetical protein
VLEDLPRTVQTQAGEVELSVWLAGLAAVLLLGSLWAAARWDGVPGLSGHASSRDRSGP